MRSFILRSCVVLAVTISVVPARAWAEESNSRAVAVTTSYGLLGGVALGLASIPLTRDSSSVVYGALVGLYIGLGAGIYHITHRDDPENPLRVPPEEKQKEQSRLEHENKPILVVSVPVLRF